MLPLPPGDTQQDNEYLIVPNLVEKFKKFFGGKPPKWLDAIILRQVQDVDNDKAAEVVEESLHILEEVLAEYRHSKMALIEGGKTEDDKGQ